MSVSNTLAAVTCPCHSISLTLCTIESVEHVDLDAPAMAMLAKIECPGTAWTMQEWQKQ